METEILIGARKKVNPSEILSLKGDVNYTTVYFTDGLRKEVVATTLKKIQNRLQPFPHFFRISKNTIINLNCIEAIENDAVRLFSGDLEHTSRRRRKAFLEFSESIIFSQMKKILFLLLLSLNFSYGQINFEGNVFDLDPTPYTYADPGTNSYTHVVTPTPPIGCSTVRFRLFRYDGYWYQVETSICGIFWNYRTANKIITPNPPCSDNWYGRVGISWIPALPPATPNNPVIPGTLTPSLKNITGTSCSATPVSLSGTMTPYYFLPPSLTTLDILAIVSPPTGALVWDITAMCLKVYNGTAWVCL